MAAVPLLKDSNVAAMTSRENTLMVGMHFSSYKNTAINN